MSKPSFEIIKDSLRSMMTRSDCPSTSEASLEMSNPRSFVSPTSWLSSSSAWHNSSMDGTAQSKPTFRYTNESLRYVNTSSLPSSISEPALVSRRRSSTTSLATTKSSTRHPPSLRSVQTDPARSKVPHSSPLSRRSSTSSTISNASSTEKQEHTRESLEEDIAEAKREFTKAIRTARRKKRELRRLPRPSKTAPVLNSLAPSAIEKMSNPQWVNSHSSLGREPVVLSTPELRPGGEKSPGLLSRLCGESCFGSQSRKSLGRRETFT